MKLTLVPIFFCLVQYVYSANEVKGCGGFLKSHADIDFSKVEIRLLTKQGSIKDRTDCAPSNGYYFLPIFESGDYIVQIVPPAGWSFEPETVPVNFNGETDICSTGDVNFVFKGFGITGKVSILGTPKGAKGVEVVLRSEGGQDVRSTFSDENGDFSFTPIIPGKYIIRAQHDRWQFSKSEKLVTVTAGNTELPLDTLIISGFDATGYVVSDGRPFSHNVGLILYGKKYGGINTYCPPVPKDVKISHPTEEFDKQILCFTKPNEKGEYQWKALPPGSYAVKPVLLNPEIQMNIKPDQIEFSMHHDSTVIDNKFDVVGFSSTGRILTAPNGKGVANAKIFLNGKHIATTNDIGVYILNDIKGGSYTLKVEAVDLKFDETNVEIAMKNPSLPDIYVSGFKVCGQVVSKQSYTVAITKLGSTFHTQTKTSPNNGEWCLYLSNGRYSIQVQISEEDTRNGIQFFPLSQQIEVKSSSQRGVVFSQLRATVTGKVKCLPDPENNCSGLEVKLHALDSNGNNVAHRDSVLIEKDGSFKFTEVLPGHYTVNVPAKKLCWENTSQNINVVSAAESIPTFTQTGYAVTFISTHDATITYKLRGSTESIQQNKLTAGLNTICVKRAGQYELTVSSCHGYGKDLPKTFTTSDVSDVQLNAITHSHGIRILSEESAKHKIKVTTGDKVSYVEPKAESERVDGYVSYRHVFQLGPNDAIELEPESEIMLFKPSNRQLTGTNDCVDVAFNFIATKGLIIEGRTEPAIENVNVKLSFPQNPEQPELLTTTNDKGHFKFPPIDGTLQTKLEADKLSYVFKEYDAENNVFKAHKLCEIIVSVVDEERKQLPGVLFSLSGSNSFRQNRMAGDDGTIKFHSLTPDEYYLRPMLKEYKFQPNAKVIKLTDGLTSTHEIVGIRVAYSVYGQVNSLNGEPVSGITVEASVEDPCPMHVEETVTEASGIFRIRGLQPNCVYNIHYKLTPEFENYRMIPTTRKVQIAQGDVKDVKLIAISPITFVDVTARVFANANDIYKTLKISMSKAGKTDSPVYTQRIESPHNVKHHINPGSMAFFPRIPLDGQSYVVELSTTLSEKTYKYTLPSASFKANHSSIYVYLEFNPELKSTDGDLAQNSIPAIIIISLVVFVFFKQQLALDIVLYVYNKISVAITDAIDRHMNNKDSRSVEPMSEADIAKLAQSINSVSKKKSKKNN